MLYRDFRPEKSRKNTREKRSYFFHVCWYSQSAADTSLAFGATRSGRWMNGEPSRFSAQGSLSELSRIMAAKTLKKSVSLTDSEVQTFLEGEKPIYKKKNRKLRIQWLWCWHFSRPRTKIDNWKIRHRPILAVNKWEFWWNIVSDVYIFTKGKKSINTAKNENVELTHTQVFCGRLCALII